MIRVSVQVRSGTASFRATVRAESIRQVERCRNGSHTPPILEVSLLSVPYASTCDAPGSAAQVLLGAVSPARLSFVLAYRVGVLLQGLRASFCLRSLF